MRRQPIRSCALVVIFEVLALGGCGSVESDKPATSYGVGGRLRGLWAGSDGVALRLEADDTNTLLTVSANGDFRFATGLPRGASYTVTVAASPASHACTIAAGGNGVIADADVSDVTVACTGPATSIALSGRWSPAFDPSQDTQRFAGSVAMQGVALTVSGASLTGVQIGGAAVALGSPSAPIALPLGTTAMPVLVTAGALSKTYELVFDRGGARLEQLVYGKASNPGASDGFGYAIALSGDTLAVGAYLEGSSAIGVNGDQESDAAAMAGAVYVFVRTGAQWTQQAYIKASNTDANDQFGRAIALSGDTLAVGATGESSAGKGANSNGQSDNTAPLSGAVYVFVRTGTRWAQQAYLKASNTDRLDAFGAAVALSGNTLAVGATGESSSLAGINRDPSDNGANTSGAVYVFVRTGTEWTQQAYLKASNTGAGDNFGHAVALSGDTLAVGAINEDSAAAGVGGDQSDSTRDAGAVYVFARSGATWTQQAYIKASTPSEDDLFGWTVALSGDTLAVGALGEDSGATGVNGNQADNSADGAGALYVFVRTGTAWTQQAYLKPSNTGAGQNFGAAVALSGDLVVVGAPGEGSAATGVDGNQADNAAPRSGAVYLFARSGAAWTQRTYVKASNSGSDDAFGQAVALSGDLVAIGAIGESSETAGINPVNGGTDDTAPGAGAIYVLQ